MSDIVQLDELTINKIAAGEVIERPANVVKELVENSIDAGATSVLIEIKKGGKSLIKIQDNGKGMTPDDMDLSLERHATSKIRQIEDLENTYTMGFRGEALASISAVSKLTMISKTKDSNFGNKLVAKAGNIIEAEETAANQGTTITVEGLFYNTPVRYKFLKQDSTEARYIKEWVEKVALANTDKAFKLIIDGKQVFQSSGNEKIEDVIYTIYGKEIKENIVNVNYELEGIKVTGVVGNTRIAKDSRKDQIIFLNKRNIKNATLTSSADQAFKGATGIGKYGFFILNIEMPADYYDVNVHPTKQEVRFNDENKLYKVFYHSIKEALLNSEFLGNSQTEEKKRYVENEYSFLTNHFNNYTKDTLSVREEDLKYETANELIRREENRNIDYKYLGILFRTYIVVEIGEEIFLIDQHAAHERLLYEQIKANYKDNLKNNIQMRLVPEILSLSHKEIEFVKENIELFKNIGFIIEPFGQNSIKINGIPNLEYKTDTKQIFLDILDEMVTGQRSNLKDVEERFIATVACKAAVKAHMDLKEPEVRNLITGLLSLQNPYTCPHGRPTTIKISKKEIIKKLGN